ncbi:MAG: PEP-CTERM sorting domain-containing protein [Planctomycetota bacterium]
MDFWLCVVEKERSVTFGEDVFADTANIVPEPAIIGLLLAGAVFVRSR